MYHSITFGDGSLYPAGHEKEGQFMGKNTWDDWHMIPSSRPTISSPGVSANFVEIPGRLEGPIDMSEYLTNRPIYGSRSGSFEFIVENDHQYWTTLKRELMAFFHGKRMKMCLEDDPGFYWEGRFTFNSWQSKEWNSTVTIDYTLDPFKTRINDQGVNDIIWDTFNFEQDADWYTVFHNLTINNGAYTVNIEGYDYPYPLVAKLVDGSSVTASLNGGSVVLNSLNESKTIGEIQLGKNQLVIYGDGVIDISLRERSL